MAVASTREPQFTSLLLVQRNRAAGKALSRLLGPYYGEVRWAETPTEAEQLLHAEGSGPCHLVCGQEFGPAEQKGHALIAAFRLRYPEIEKAILATGTENLPTELGPVDAVYDKASSPRVLLALLGARKPEAGAANEARSLTPDAELSLGPRHLNGPATAWTGPQEPNSAAEFAHH